MMKKVAKLAVPIILCVVLVMAFVSSCGGEKVADKEVIKVGMSRSITGSQAAINASAFEPISNAFVKMVNDAGGIYVEEYGKKLPIELIVYDDKSDPNTMVRLTEKLIVEDKVDFLWPACGTSMIFAQAPIANKHGYLLITAEGGATQLEDALASLPNLFVTLSFSDWYQIPVLADMMKSKDVKTAYIVSIADLHGIEYAGVANIEFGKAGIEIIGSRSVPPDIKDLSPIIKAAKDSGADAFLLFAYPDQIMPAVGVSMQLDYNPKIWLGGPGVNFGFFHTGFGPAVEGCMGWTMYARGISPELDAMADILYTGGPEDIQDWWGHPCYWAGLEIWKEAIEKTGTLNQDTIRDYIAANHFQTVFGDTWFTMYGDGGGLLAKECHTGEVGQWIDGVFEVVGPFDKATAEWVYPKPNWPAAPAG